MPARLEMVALAGAIAALTNRPAQKDRCAGNRSMDSSSTSPLDALACFLEIQNGPKVHVRVLWGAEGGVGLGEWGDYFRPLRVSSAGGHVQLDVQRHTQEFVVPKEFIPFQVRLWLLPFDSSALASTGGDLLFSLCWVSI